MSRHIKDTETEKEEDSEDENKKEQQCNCVIEGVTKEEENRIRVVKTEYKEKIRELLKDDQEYKTVIEAIRNGKNRVTLEGHRLKIGHKAIREEDGIIKNWDRVYIPKEMRMEQLIGAHNGHKKRKMMTLDLAKRKAWWPGSHKNIDSFIENCEHCLKNKPSKNSASPRIANKGDRSWQCITSDFFQIDGTTFFHITCRLTNKSIPQYIYLMSRIS